MLITQCFHSTIVNFIKCLLETHDQSQPRWWGETGEGGRLGEKGAGGVRDAEEEGTGSGIPKVAGSRRKRENYATLRNILQSEKCKEAGATKWSAGTGIKGYGKWKV